METDPTTLSLVELAQAIAQRKMSAREVTKAHLDRIDRLDPHVASFVSVDSEGAMAAADDADAAVARGEKLGPLHGVPLAHKDMFYRSGTSVACGSKVRKDFVPTNTATVLKRLDDAGAISLGSLAMVEFAMGPHGYNANLRQCRNPWALDHVPCGSSSGSGVAVASRFVAGSLGSDTGGSIRCPASACGVVGLLPTYSRVSRHGVMPMSVSLDSIGPLARTAEDCARLMNVIAGRDPADGTSSDVPTPDYEAGLDRPIKGLRIGVPSNYFSEGVSSEVEASLADSLDVLRSQGAIIVEIAMPLSIESVAELHPMVMKAEGAANHHLWMREFPDRYSSEVRQRLQAGFFVPAVDYIQALKLRGGFLREFGDAIFSKVDVLHTPVLPRAAPTITETTTADGPAYLSMVVSLTRNTKIVNYLGLPAISVPCGVTGGGLPISFQLIGRPFSEALLLRIAHTYQKETDWRVRTLEFDWPNDGQPDTVSSATELARPGA
jgi:aspartyl-tRNA(Asn)/glutamyl-tRNA(Gln) amidotransferase subunit A